MILSSLIDARYHFFRRVAKGVPALTLSQNRLDEYLNHVQDFGLETRALQPRENPYPAGSRYSCEGRAANVKVSMMRFACGTITLATIAAMLPASSSATGQQTFSAQCSMCHQPNGAGVPGSFPRVAGRVPVIAAAPEGRRYLANVILYGLYGPITVDGKQISGLMPGMASLSDQAIADVLNHVLTLQKPAKKVAPFTASEIAAVRAAGRKTGAAVASDRTRLVQLKLIP